MECRDNKRVGDGLLETPPDEGDTIREVLYRYLSIF
jgi:hypothetical protein